MIIEKIARSFRNYSIKQKLVSIMMLTSGIVLLIAALIFVISEIISFQKGVKQNLSILADIIGNNTSAALTFNDEKAAAEALAGLSANPHILAAYIITNDNRIFAKYIAKGADWNILKLESGGKDSSLIDREILSKLIKESNSFWEWDFDLAVAKEIFLKGQMIGMVVIQSDIKELTSRLAWLSAIFVSVTLGIFFIAYRLSSELQGLISKPILTLSQAMKDVSNYKNYSIRSEKYSDDEIGSLAEGFNDMLEQIQERDTELELHRKHLEELVTRRTAELERAKEQLEQELVERKRTEEELKKFAIKLERSNHELQDFAYIASHDLQEPLRKVTAFGDRLKTKFAGILGDQGCDYLERMQNAASRMNSLINGLLDYSRVTTKAQPFIPVNLTTVAQEVLSDLEVRIEQVKGRVEVSDLPTIDADPLQMRQLLQNLIGNALKFHRKKVAPVLKIQSRLIPSSHYFIKDGIKGFSDKNPPTNEYCRIIVEDNGIGFDEKYLDRIFGVFQRLHGRSEYEGTGIGLAVCNKIAERHNGNITAKSTLGEGSAFIVTLPVKQSLAKEVHNV